jgi:hypothetical protein
VDPLAALLDLAGVAPALDAARDRVDDTLRHRALRRHGGQVAAEAGLRGAVASAALEGHRYGLEEVRGGTVTDPVLQGALRVAEGLGPLVDLWPRAPRQVLARLHVLAARGVVPDSVLGRPAPSSPAGGRLSQAGGGRSQAGGGPSQAGGGLSQTGGRPDAPVGPGGGGLDAPAGVIADRLDALAGLVAGNEATPPLLLAAIVHAELLTVRPFAGPAGIVARAAARLTLIGRGLDPRGLVAVDVGHLVREPEYVGAAGAYATGTPDGVRSWLRHYAAAVTAGADETVAIGDVVLAPT